MCNGVRVELCLCAECAVSRVSFMESVMNGRLDSKWNFIGLSVSVLCSDVWDQETAFLVSVDLEVTRAWLLGSLFKYIL